MKKLFALLLVIWTMTATQSTATAQTAANVINISFTNEIGDSISYSAFELAEYIFIGQTPSHTDASSILEEYQEFTGEEEDPLILQYGGGDFICIHYDADGEIVLICLKNEFGWCESDPHQENFLLKLGLLVEFSVNVFDWQCLLTNTPYPSDQSIVGVFILFEKKVKFKYLEYIFIFGYFLTLPWGVHSTNHAFVCTQMMAFSLNSCKLFAQT